MEGGLMFRTFAQFLFKLLFPEGQEGMKETFGNSGGEGGGGGGGVIFLHKNGNSGEVGGLSWNSLLGGGMDIFWNYTIDHASTCTMEESNPNYHASASLWQCILKFSAFDHTFVFTVYKKTT